MCKKNKSKKGKEIVPEDRSGTGYPQYDKDYNAKTKLTIVITECIVLTTCIGVLLSCVIFRFYPKVERPSVNITFQADSTITTKSLSETEKAIQCYIDDNEQHIQDRYEYFIDQKEENNNLFTTASIVVGIIISLLGFIGYRTLRDIEINATKTASEEATKAASEAAMKMSHDILDKRIKDIVTGYMDERIKTIYQKQIENITTGHLKDSILQKDLDTWCINLKTEINETISLRLLEFKDEIKSPTRTTSPTGDSLDTDTDKPHDITTSETHNPTTEDLDL